MVQIDHLVLSLWHHMWPLHMVLFTLHVGLEVEAGYDDDDEDDEGGGGGGEEAGAGGTA